jgi:hypothetical protein
MAPKIAARLSILGLPLGESMRCRLLLRVAVIFANPSIRASHSRDPEGSPALGECWVSLDSSHNGFFGITSERHVDYLLRFGELWR